VPGFPAGHRTGYVEVEVPVSGWFPVRAQDAAPHVPGFLLAVGIGVNFNYAL
jgi:hypothetical protein